MTFKNRPNPKTTVGVMQISVPKVGITQEALTKMSIYVKECSDEIGWMGTARKNERDNTIVIDNVYLFDQDVHGATTEITPEGLTDFAEELLAQGDAGIEVWNNLKMWGHSHVNMDVSPSGQDNAQMETFKEGGHDWFIRLIANKKGDMKLDIYDYITGVQYIDVPWIELDSEDEQAVKAEIDALYAILETLEQERLTKHLEPIKAEMKEKVHKIGARTTGITYAGGSYINGKWVGNTSKEPVEEKKTYGDSTGNDNSNPSKKTTTSSGNGDTVDRPGFYEIEDVFLMDDDVLEYFNHEELLELAENTRFDQLQSDLELYGYYNYFTDNDVERIYRVCRKVQNKYGHMGGYR